MKNTFRNRTCGIRIHFLYMHPFYSDSIIMNIAESKLNHRILLCTFIKKYFAAKYDY